MYNVLDIDAIRADRQAYFFLGELGRDCLRALAPSHIANFANLFAYHKTLATHVDVIVSSGGIRNKLHPGRKPIYKRLVGHIRREFSLPETGKLRLHFADGHVAKVEFHSEQ